MNPLIEAFPTTLSVAGGEYAINSGFKKQAVSGNPEPHQKKR